MRAEVCCEFVMRVSAVIHSEISMRRPRAVAEKVYFDFEAHGFVSPEVQHFLVKTIHQKRIGGLTRFHLLFDPNSAQACWFAHFPQIIYLSEPQSCLWLPERTISLVAPQHKQSAPITKIRHDAQMLADRANRQNDDRHKSARAIRKKCRASPSESVRSAHRGCASIQCSRRDRRFERLSAGDRSATFLWQTPSRWPTPDPSPWRKSDSHKFPPTSACLTLRQTVFVRELSMSCRPIRPNGLMLPAPDNQLCNKNCLPRPRARSR